MPEFYIIYSSTHLANMDYEQLRQWRDICEYLNGAWYKFISDVAVANANEKYSFLLPRSQEYRQELWSLYMIQFAQWGTHPINFHRNERKYRKVTGWRLCMDWETKINFLEQIVLFNRNPDDLAQPWKQGIWEAFFRRREREIELTLQYEEYRQRELERGRAYRQSREQKQKAIALGECPLGLRCQEMSGAFHSQDCENLSQCNQWLHRL
jgi:hypothetical protein